MFHQQLQFVAFAFLECFVACKHFRLRSADVMYDVCVCMRCGQLVSIHFVITFRKGGHETKLEDWI